MRLGVASDAGATSLEDDGDDRGDEQSRYGPVERSMPSRGGEEPAHHLADQDSGRAARQPHDHEDDVQ